MLIIIATAGSREKNIVSGTTPAINNNPTTTSGSIAVFSAPRCYTVPNPSRGCGVSASPAPVPSTIEASTLRKLRTHIIPFVFVLFVINFVDRINIGFAALTMNKELAITSQQFGLLSGIFFWGYFVFEIPSNLLLHKLGAVSGLHEYWSVGGLWQS